MNDLETQDTKSPVTPAEMIKAAVAGGADLDELGKLLTIQERWEANEARKAYHKAMAEFKSNPITIDKDKKVGYSTNKGNVGYTHASLANVVQKISVELCKYGLSASWRTNQNGKIVVTCKITHEKGHFEETTLEADADVSGSKNPIQAIGSTITYLERYTLLALTGMATSDQDDDANSVNEVITDTQLSSMLDILDNAPDSTEKKDKFLKFMGVETMAAILARDYKKGIKALNAMQERIEGS